MHASKCTPANARQQGCLRMCRLAPSLPAPAPTSLHLAAPSVHPPASHSPLLPGFSSPCRYLYRQYRIRKDHTSSVLDLEQQAQFKQQYVATQVLGATPVA